MRTMLIERDGVTLHVREWAASGRPVVLLHGLASTSRIWDLVAPLLVAEGLRPIAPDLRGHGESGRPDSGYAFGDVVADVLAVAGHLEIDRPVLAGHSWGASVALAVAADHPKRASGVVAVDGAFGGMRDRWTWDQAWERMRPPKIRATREQIVGMIRGGPLGSVWSEALEDAALSLFEPKEDGLLGARLPLAAHEEIFRAIYHADQHVWLAGLAVPALMLPTRQGPDDEWARNKEAFLATVTNPRVRVEWIDDSIHDVPWQRPDVVAQRLASFVAEAL